MFVQPSGLIFLVIIAIWAAYLLQHWVGRREHLATARSVDRFSDAMRVLERRTPLPESDLTSPQPRSYSVSPARPSRPEVVVKRVQPQPQPQPQFPSPARPAAVVRPTHGARTSGVSARRIRGLSLLASLSIVLVVSPLAAFSVLAWWSVPIAVAVLVVDFAWLRHAAATQRAARRSKARMRSGNAPSQPGRVPTPRAVTKVEPGVATSVVGAGDLSGPFEPSVELQNGSQTESQAEVDLSGWAPVPVPPPTYTLKAKAERPEPTPATVTQPATTQPSSFDGLVDEGELDGLLDRRRA